MANACWLQSHSLVVNLEHIRAIIKADMVVVFDPQDAPDRPFQVQRKFLFNYYVVYVAVIVSIGSHCMFGDLMGRMVW